MTEELGTPLLRAPAVAVSGGIAVLAAELEAQGVGVERIDWRPPAAAAADLERLAAAGGEVAAANREALSRMSTARPVVLGIASAADAIGLERGCFLHAGPPVAWEAMCGPMRGAIAGAAVLEGIADEPERALRDAAAGRYELAPCHEHLAVGPMAGVISPSMPVWIVESSEHGNRAHCTLNEGLGRVLRYGAYDAGVIERLRWIERSLAPILAEALARLSEPLDLRAIGAQAVEMGDELHNRNRAGTSLLLRALAPALVASERPSGDLSAAVRFIASNDHFFLNLSMAMAKATADAAAGIEGSSVVTAMARNGTDFGIRLSGTGETWFTGPAGRVEGLYFPGYGDADANPDLGDSAITETVGLGGFAMGAAPAIVRFVGGDSELALATTRSMYDIACGESEAFRVPALGFRGTPLGIDAREVVHTGLLPQINTGIAHREPGVGQIGAGLVTPPMEAFAAAVGALAGRGPARGEAA
ncbi:MAG: DUF1116 domain-containing protein [Solirubrobacterales bacterium]|nr:DUF1116 domain-containing protein [Solirubrobacterales bacterium]